MTNSVNSDARLEQLKKCSTLSEFVPLRAKTHPDMIALRQYDRAKSAWTEVSYKELQDRITAWRRSFSSLELNRGARVAILLNNSVDAVLSDQAVMADALIPVPLHAIDTPASSAYIIADSGASCFVTNKLERWNLIKSAGIEMPGLKFVVLTEETLEPRSIDGVEISGLAAWLKRGESVRDLPRSPQAEELAAIVYTSGTTGKPKGVMLTHHNIVTNVIVTLDHIKPMPPAGFKFLSFLPLSHTFERTCGYYLALGMACTVTYNRSIMLLSEDLKIVKPDVLISVPRIYERIYARINDKLSKAPSYARWLFNTAVAVGWRRFCRANKMKPEASAWSFLDPVTGPLLDKLVSAKIREQFGGNLKIAISGGAAISHKVARTFCALGLAPIQGYGMTEASPIIAGNSLTLNQPDTVGIPIGTEIRLAEQTREIQVRGPSVMKGYWNRPEDTARTFTEDGWLKTGDIGEYNETGLLRIRGRIKEIIVTSTGEKIPPVDLELAIETDPIFAQTYVVGDDRPFISLVTVLNPDEWKKLAATLNLNPEDPESLKTTAVRNALLRRAKAAASDFPHYALPRNVTAELEPWTIENGLLTPTLKLKRAPLHKKFAEQIEAMYASHK